MPVDQSATASKPPPSPPSPPRRPGGPRYFVEFTLSIIAIVSVAFGVFFFFESRYAKHMHMERLDLRLEKKILVDEKQALERKIKETERELGVHDDIEILQAQLKEFKEEKESIKNKIEQLDHKIAELR